MDTEGGRERVLPAFFTVGDVWVGPIPDSRGEHYERLLWGPKPPVVIQRWGGAKIVVQVSRTLGL